MTAQLKFMALGGLGEIGSMNCMLYETEQTAILVDCGVGFVDDRYPGVNVMIPDFDALERVRDKLCALVLTHGHEDHVGGIAYLMRRFPMPVYATDFTRGIVHNKFEEFRIKDSDVRELNFGQVIQIGDIEVEPVFVNHSIMDVAALLIKANGRSVFHCTDFKIDHAAPENRVLDLARFKKIGTDGLDVLLLDSTNVFGTGWTLSESKVRANLFEVFTQIKGRILTCLFSSNSFRLQSILECARLSGRKVALTGRSTKEYTRIATSLGRMDTTGVELYDVEDISQFPDNEILVVVTGSQAEPRSVLSRLSKNMFRPFKIREGDTLLMSSKMIPGNEGRIIEMLDRVSLLGARVVTYGMEPAIHASGHAKQDELREVMRLTRPKYFVPIHGSYTHLKKHVEVAAGAGIKEEQCRVILDGEVIELSENSFEVTQKVVSKEICVSENPDYFIDPEAVTRRKKMAWNGLVTVSVIFDHEKSRVKLPVVLNSEGIFGGKLEVDLLDELEAVLKAQVYDHKPSDVEKLQKFFKVEIRHFYKQRCMIRPEVVVLVHEV